MLRRFDATHFSLRAADALGEPRWEIRRALDEAVWIEPGAHRYCRLNGRFALRTQHWVSNLSILELEGLLTGDWPPAEGLAAPVEFAPGSTVAGPPKRRISGERAAGRWTSWTLREDDEPVAWFQRNGPESLLSVRQPAVQLRWRISAQSPLDVGPGPGGERFALLPEELAASSREFACPDNEIP